MLDPADETLFLRYLRGSLSADEREAFMRQLEDDDAFFTALEEFETDWIDRYARGELSATENADVAAYLEETHQEHRAAFAVALSRIAGEGDNARPAAVAMPDRVPTSRPRWNWPTIGAVAAMAAVAVLAITLYRSANSMPSDDGSMEATVHQTAQAPLVTITIPAGIARGPHDDHVHLVPAGAARIRLRLEIPENRAFPTYRIVLLGDGDQVVWTSNVSRDDSPEHVIQFEIPRDVLRDGSHEFALYGINHKGNLAPDGTEELLVYYPLRLATEPDR